MIRECKTCNKPINLDKSGKGRRSYFCSECRILDTRRVRQAYYAMNRDKINSVVVDHEENNEIKNPE